jgi:K+-dependent Na+/Ca+ exchanger-like protein
MAMSIEARKAIVAGRKSFLSRNYSRFGLLVLGIVAAAVAMGQAAGEGHEEGRKLSEYAPGICDGFLYQNYFYLILALYCWAIYYMFWGLAIVCDDYFVASLEEISEALGLSPDVAGATFMAAGSSAPELFTSLMGVFAVKNDVGVGTIVGSAVFNLCCIIGGTAMFTPGVLKIDWKPITRDSFFYGLSIAAMIYVLADGTVTTVEAASLMGFYVVYVIVMAFNQGMMDAIDKCTGKGAQDKDTNHEFDGKDGEDDEEESGPLAQAIVAPIAVLFETTIPDCTKEENKTKYVLTFTMSIMWIGVLSYFMVEWASKLGCMLNIHPAVMGVTILAAGTSVPDAIGSLLVAKNGQGDMSVSNAIGSNVFDILLGLGLPWTLNGLIYGVSLDVDSGQLLPLSIMLISTLGAVYISAALSGFTLSKPLGAFFFSLYFLFVAYSLLHEFGYVEF